MPPRKLAGACSTRRTEAPLRRAAIAAHRAALPPPTTRTSTACEAASLMIAFGRSCSAPRSLFTDGRSTTDRTADRVVNRMARPGFGGRRRDPPADRPSATRLRDGVHHALVVFVFRCLARGETGMRYGERSPRPLLPPQL